MTGTSMVLSRRPVVAEAWQAWRTKVDFATRLVAEAPGLDIIAHDPLNRHGGGGGPMSLREVLVGTIDEYARHVGHVDLLRERIDERIGQSSPARETADGVGHRDGPDTVVRAVGVDGHGSGRDG